MAPADGKAGQIRELAGHQLPHQAGVEVDFPVVHLHPESESRAYRPGAGGG
jgi:hypothetical protein